MVSVTIKEFERAASQFTINIEVKEMVLTRETLKAMIREYQGFPLSDEELERVLPELENYCQAVEQLRALDLSAVFSSRLLRVREGE